MTTTLPGWLASVLDLVGMHFPEGDEDKLVERARAFDAFNAALDQAKGDLTGTITRQIEAAVGDQIEQAIKQYIDELAQQSLGAQSQNLAQLASQNDVMAEATQFGKYSIILTLGALAVQLAFAAANFWNGAGEAEAAAAIVEGRVVIGGVLEGIATKVLGKLATSAVTKAIAKQAVIGALFGAGVDAAAQGLQIAQGTRSHFDGKQFAADTAAGTAGGITGGLIGHTLAGVETKTALGAVAKTMVGGAAAGGGGAVAGALAAGAVTGNIDHAFDGAGGQALLGAATAGGAVAREAIHPTGGRPVQAVHAPEAPKLENGKPPATTEHAQPNGAHEPAAPAGEPPQHTSEHAPGQEHSQASPTERQTPHEQAQPVAAVEHRAPAAEPKPAVEQRAAQAGEQVRANPQAQERASLGPAHNAATGERAPAAPTTTPRVEPQPAASLSNTAGDRPHTGAAATMRDMPAAKASEPVAAKPGEHVRATAGLSEARPAEPSTARHEAVPQASPAEHEARPTDPARSDLPARQAEAPNNDVRPPNEIRHNEDRPPAPAVEHAPHSDQPLTHAAPLPEGTPRPTEPPQRHAPTGDGPRSHEPRPDWVGQALHDGKLPTSPKDLKSFWDHLTATDKDHLYLRDPMIGCRDGVPMADRNHYNQHELRRQYVLNPDARLAELVNALDSKPLEGRARASERLLVTFDPAGHGAIALGDPDKASHTAVFVGGTGASESSFAHGVDRPGSQGYIERGERMVDETMFHIDAQMGENASAVVWLDYDAPKWVSPNNPGANRGAEHAAPRLREFCEGLRATHEGDQPGQTTVIGHSYGTRAVGESAKASGGGLDADRIVNLASPGMGVKTVDELALHGTTPNEIGSRVYSTIDPHDFLTVIERLGIEDRAHGTLPTDAARFGGTVFDSTAHKGPWWLGDIKLSAHMLYWEHDTAALINTGLIIAGLEPFPLGGTPLRGEF